MKDFSLMITPPYLKRGDKIALVSPARRITPEEALPAIRIFEGWGLQVVEGDHLYDCFNQFAGPDESRLSDLQKALDDDSVRAVICSRGGYGTVRIIDRLDFSRFVQHPKWIAGYSDVTVMHSHIHRHFDIETLHAIMPVNIKDQPGSSQSVTTLKKALFGEPIAYSIPASPLNRPGMAHGQLIGGNLSILYSLNNTSSDISTRGKILFIEDLDEYLYHLDRMMMNLRRSGKLEDLSGLIVGGMMKMHDNSVAFGKSAAEIIAEAVNDYPYPVCFDFPAGHLDDNRALVLGREVIFEVSDEVRLGF
jgi:muramoyltetrapeptide carboxypeptidase